MAVIESFSLRIPIIISDRHGNRNSVDESVGWVLEYNNVALWVKVILQILSDRKQLIDKRQAAYDKVQQHYTFDLFFQRHLSLYQHLKNQ